MKLARTCILMLVLQYPMPVDAQPSCPPPGYTTQQLLDLSEVARADRVEAIFNGEQRQQLVNAAAAYLSGISDYRGFSDAEGWRHGAAHGSDLVLQLALNERIDACQAAKHPRLPDGLARVRFL